MIVPYSDEWYEARRGKITASSRLHPAVYGSAKVKNTILAELELELYSPPRKTRSNKYMEWGKQNEANARRLVEVMRDVDTTEPGLVFHPACSILGATPDYCVTRAPGDVRVAGEIKCPYYEKYHLLLSQGLHNPSVQPEWMQKYYTQVQGQMLILAAEVGWFSSYHPHQPPGQQLYFEEVEPDCALMDRMLESCAQMAEKLKTGSRFGTGKTLSAEGIPQLF